MRFSHFSLVFLDATTFPGSTLDIALKRGRERKRGRTPRNARARPLARRDKKESGGGGGDAMVKEETGKE